MAREAGRDGGAASVGLLLLLADGGLRSGAVHAEAEASGDLRDTPSADKPQPILTVSPLQSRRRC